MDTHLIQTPHYDGQFALSQEKKAFFFSKLNSPNTNTPLIQKLSMSLSVSVVMRFDCINFQLLQFGLCFFSF